MAAAPLRPVESIGAFGAFDTLDSVASVVALDPVGPIAAVAATRAVVAIAPRLISAAVLAARAAIAVTHLGAHAAVLELRNHPRPVDDGLNPELAEIVLSSEPRHERVEVGLIGEAQPLELHLATLDLGFERRALDRSHELHLRAGLGLHGADQRGEGR